MNPCILYLSGPMSGLPDHNFGVFRAAARDLRAQGYIIIDPAANFGGARTLPRETYLRHDLLTILTIAQGVVCLPNWEASEGAIVEVIVAQSINLPIYDYRRGMPPSKINPFGQEEPHE